MHLELQVEHVGRRSSGRQRQVSGAADPYDAGVTLLEHLRYLWDLGDILSKIAGLGWLALRSFSPSEDA